MTARGPESARPDEVEGALSFDRVPDLYDRVRPSYPPAVFDRIAAELPASPLVVEVGPGTGKATTELLARGARVVAVEPGENLTAFLRRRFPAETRDGRLALVASPFETADLPPGSADAVVSASAYHWVDPWVQLDGPARLLRPSGVVAVVDLLQVASPVDQGYFDRVQEVYDRYGQGRPAQRRQLPTADTVVPDVHRALAGDPRYTPPSLDTHVWDQTYSTAQYADLLRTYSGTLVMEPERAEQLVRELTDVADADFGGTVTRPLVVALTLARLRRSGPR